MINIWEAVQGFGFMVVLGWITRSMARSQTLSPDRRTPAEAAKPSLPSPRGAAEAQESAGERETAQGA